MKWNNRLLRALSSFNVPILLFLLFHSVYDCLNSGQNIILFIVMVSAIINYIYIAFKDDRW